MKGRMQKISTQSDRRPPKNRSEAESYEGVQIFMRVEDGCLTTEHPKTEYPLLERILSSANLNVAYLQMKRNGGAAGVDRMDCDRLLGYLIEHGETLNWNVARVGQIVSKPPYFGVKPRDYKEGSRKYRSQFHGKEPWWGRPSAALLEDALNVIDIEPVGLSDIFHFLCAATLVNAYVNRMNFIKTYPDEYIRRMFTTKQQIFDGLKAIARQKIRDVEVVMDKAQAVMVNITVNGLQFQFSYRGASMQTLREFSDMRIPQNGRFNGHSLQAIATALYQYSHILRRGQSESNGQNGLRL